MKQVTELAPAKLNLYLKVLRKRADGYHDIETLFERIDIFDKIIVSSTKDGIDIKCDNPSVPTEKGSLCYRAVELMRKKISAKGGKTASGAAIKIEKHIPVAAGLGGGSSDAASILKALNNLWSLKLKREELMEMAGFLGADVSFFLADASFAIGTGRGDRIKPVNYAKSFWHAVISPNITLLSGEIYKLYSETHPLNLTITGSVDRILPPTLNISNIGRLKPLLHNDLESIVLSREPLIKDIKNTLGTGNGENSLVSGSGPSVFCLHETRKEALKAKENCLRCFPDSKGWSAYITKTY